MAAYALADKAALPVGAAAGLLGSMVGVGGGVLIVPALTACGTQVLQKVVSGTSLVAVIATSAASTAEYVKTGQVDVPAAGIIASAAVLSAPLGARATSVLSQAALKRCLGVFLWGAAPLVPLKHHLFKGNAGDAREQRRLDAPRIALLGTSGAVAGFASGLLGIGGGTLVSPMLALSGEYTQVQAVATSLAAMFVPSCVALATHARLGNVRWPMGVSLAVGAAFGAAGGARFAVQAPPGTLESVFGCGMGALGAKTLLRG